MARHNHVPHKLQDPKKPGRIVKILCESKSRPTLTSRIHKTNQKKHVSSSCTPTKREVFCSCYTHLGPKPSIDRYLPYLKTGGCPQIKREEREEAGRTDAEEPPAPGLASSDVPVQDPGTRDPGPTGSSALLEVVLLLLTPEEGVPPQVRITTLNLGWKRDVGPVSSLVGEED